MSLPSGTTPSTSRYSVNEFVAILTVCTSAKGESCADRDESAVAASEIFVYRPEDFTASERFVGGEGRSAGMSSFERVMNAQMTRIL